MTSASVRGWLPSKEGAARTAEVQDFGEEGGMILFQKEGTVPLHKFTAETLKRGTSTGQRPLVEPPSSPVESSSAAHLCSPLTGYGVWYREGPSFMAEFCLTLCWSISMLIFYFSFLS